MLVAAIAVPDAPVLVPGVGADPPSVVAVREATVGALRWASGLDVDLVLLVGSSTCGQGAARWSFMGRPEISLADLGVPDEVAPERLSRIAPSVTGMRQDIPLSLRIALRLVAHSGWHGATTAWAVRADVHALDAQALGACSVDMAERVALAVFGSGSARAHEDSPRQRDEAAAALDELAWDALSGGDLGKLAALSGEAARAADMTGWAPWQVLAGAAEEAGGLRVIDADAYSPFGVRYPIVRFLPTS